MADHLTRLVARALGLAPAVAPRRATRFEPAIASDREPEPIELVETLQAAGPIGPGHSPAPVLPKVRVLAERVVAAAHTVSGERSPVPPPPADERSPVPPPPADERSPVPPPSGSPVGPFDPGPARVPRPRDSADTLLGGPAGQLTDRSDVDDRAAPPATPLSTVDNGQRRGSGVAGSPDARGWAAAAPGTGVLRPAPPVDVADPRDLNPLQETVRGQSGPHGAPPVRITIGRIEVRAVAAPVASPAAPHPVPVATPLPERLSLAAYLRGERQSR